MNMMIQQYELKDRESGKTVSCTVSFSRGQIWVQVAGYGDSTSKDGAGFPIGIAYYEESVWVTVWGNINQDQPTERLCLDGARESNRDDTI
jgi:hypothetical protein